MTLPGARPTRWFAAPAARAAARCAAALLAALSCAAAHARGGPYEGVLSPADSLARRGQFAKAAAYADSLIGVARDSGNRPLEAVVASRRVLNWVAAGRFEDAVAEARRVAGLSRDIGDTISWGRALLAEGRAYLFRERLDEATPAYRRLLPLVRAAGDTLLEGNARLGLAYLDLRADRVARAETGYRAAIGLLERAGDAHGEITARVGLARVLQRRGREAEARLAYERIVERARATGDRANESDAWNNLGSLEADQGNPAKAAADFSRALALLRGTRRSTANIARNLAIMLLEAGRTDAAADTLERELERLPRDDRLSAFRLRTQLALVRGLQGQPAVEERMLRAQWAERDSVPADLSLEAARRLASGLERQGRAAEALEVARELDRFRAGRPPAQDEDDRIGQLAELERRNGHPREALERLRRARATLPALHAGSWRGRVAFDLRLSRAFQSVGELDSALAAIRRAGDTWERTAARVRDGDWHEPIGNSAGQLATQTARVLLDARRPGAPARRAREAFDALQRYKSRALDWRTSVVAGRPPALVTAAGLQRVLAPGEVLVDAYSSSADSSVVFVVDRERIDAHWAGGLRDAHAGVLRPLGLLTSDDPATAAFRPAAARRLAEGLFGPALDRVRRSRRVVTSLSGLLNTLPVAALAVDASPEEPLVRQRAVVAVPSASWFVRRRRAGAPQVDAARLVTVARTTDDRGRALDGVLEESRWLTDRYGDAGVVQAGERPLATVSPWMERGDLLHVASHARVSHHDPWSSAFLLGRGEDEDAWLSARAVAALRPSARLAMLASCRSVLDRGFSNESVLGLARAFHAAGVPSVVSTLWPVDDRATAAFTRRFYLALEQGRNAAEALRQAQLETRQAAGTGAPYYWAGFVLSGDPDTRVRPRRVR